MPINAKHIYRPLLAATLFTAAGSANAEWSANAAMTNNYLWRGLTQSINEAALQGGVDYADDSGFYIGTWASNVSYDSDDAYSYEHDIYFGEQMFTLVNINLELKSALRTKY